MNQKYLIALLVFFFLIHVEKTYGCNPSGSGCVSICGAKVIDANLLSNKKINLTVSGGFDGNGVSGATVDALGHFTLQVDNGPYRRLLGDPIFYNGRSCDHVNDGARHNPFTYTWDYDFETPQSGTWFDVWISIYWNCSMENGSSYRYCSSEDVHFRTYVK